MSAGTFLLLLLLPFLSNHKNKCYYIFNIVVFKLKKKPLVTSILLQAPILTHLCSIPEYSEAAYLALSLQPPSRFCTSSEFVMLC